MSSNSRWRQPIEPIFLFTSTHTYDCGMEWKQIAQGSQKLGERTKIFQGFRNPKKGGHKHFLRKLQKTTKELDLDSFEI